jgi:hypothetical protein
MRLNLLAKLTVVAALGAASSLITSTVIKKVRAQPPEPSRRKERTRLVEVSRVTANQFQGPPRTGGFKPGHTSGGHSNGMKVEVNGTLVHVIVDSYLFETRRPNSRYLWSLRIYDQKMKFVDKKDYVDNLVTTPDGVIEMTPKFEDVVTIPPGTYTVHVALLDASDGFPKGLDDLKALNPLTVLGAFKKVKTW